MMSYKVNDKHEIQELMCSGEMKTTIAEIGVLIHSLYCAFAKGDEKAAETFRRGLLLAVMTPESGIWEKDDVNCISIVQRKERGHKQ